MKIKDLDKTSLKFFHDEDNIYFPKDENDKYPIRTPRSCYIVLDLKEFKIQNILTKDQLERIE